MPLNFRHPRCGALVVFFLPLLAVLGFAHDASASITATLIGPDADVVGETVFAPDGRSDIHVNVVGLRSAPVEMEIVSDTGGIWKTPFNGVNWVIGLQNYETGREASTSPSSHNSRYTLQVMYSDGTTDHSAVTTSSSPPSTLTANFLGIGADSVGESTFSPDGRPDFQIRLGGLRSTAHSDRNHFRYQWRLETPFNGFWVVGLSNFSAGNADLYFSQYHSNSFTVQVVYADGTQDLANAVNSPPSLQPMSNGCWSRPLSVRRLRSQPTF